jgi:hypothetical protein
MRKKWLLSLALMLPLYAEAQTVPPTVDANKAKLIWAWQQGTGGPIDKFVARCGVKTQVYDRSVDVPVSWRAVEIKQLVTVPAQYFCGLTANGPGGVTVSVPAEVTFIVGAPPAAATNFQLVP